MYDATPNAVALPGDFSLEDDQIVDIRFNTSLADAKAPSWSARLHSRLLTDIAGLTADRFFSEETSASRPIPKIDADIGADLVEARETVAAHPQASRLTPRIAISVLHPNLVRLRRDAGPRAMASGPTPSILAA